LQKFAEIFTAQGAPLVANLPPVLLMPQIRNSWAQFAIKNPQISEICESKNFKSANFFQLNRK
jgi:hypothetical protein